MRPAGGFGLYLHWPFCKAKCPYCDFNSHVAGDVDQARWRRAYLAEIARLGAETGCRPLDSVFFGGGTPSLMDPDLVAAILEAVRGTWPLAKDAEITLEANPSSVESGRFRAYREAGIGRVSVGVQALDDGDLRRLGRLHDSGEARAAVETAQSVFDRTSFDLIYARPHQTVAGWRAELDEALAMAGDHLSLYQLTIEPGTAFGDRFARGGLRGLPDADAGADLFEATQERCEAAGLSAYEVSNHARPGAESRHNLIYWRAGDYVGIGPGAHGRLTAGNVRYATESRTTPGDWLAAAERGEAETRHPLSGREAAGEYLMMGLRLREGVSTSRYAALAGEPLHPEAVAHLATIGMIAQQGDRLRVTRAGRLLLNAVTQELLPD